MRGGSGQPAFFQARVNNSLQFVVFGAGKSAVMYGRAVFESNLIIWFEGFRVFSGFIIFKFLFVESLVHFSKGWLFDFAPLKLSIKIAASELLFRLRGCPEDDTIILRMYYINLREYSLL